MTYLSQRVAQYYVCAHVHLANAQICKRKLVRHWQNVRRIHDVDSEAVQEIAKRQTMNVNALYLQVSDQVAENALYLPSSMLKTLWRIGIHVM